MRLDEFNHVLETYGCSKDKWPKAIQQNCMDLLTNNPEAKELLAEHDRLQRALDEIQVPDFPGLEARVLNQDLPARPQTFIDELIDWLLPQSTAAADLWRPLTAACIPLVFGIVVGNFYSFGIAEDSPDFDNWDDELSMIAFNDIEQEQF